MKNKLLVTIYISLCLCYKVHAQAWAMHEAAEDSDGSPMSGILGFLIFIGICMLFDKLGGKSNNEE